MNIVNPNRKRHSYEQRLVALPEKVFPLLCPVLEAQWVPGWMPELVISHSGVCEKDCMFITPREMESERVNPVWIVTDHDPDNWIVQMYKVVPEHTVSKLDIFLKENEAEGTTANISYEITSIGKTGDGFLEEFTEEWYEVFMVEWETAINHYLKTGEQIA